MAKLTKAQRLVLIFFKLKHIKSDDYISNSEARGFLAGIEYRYYEDKELNKLLDVYKILLPYQSSDPSLISKMALIYYESGDLAMAEKTANMLLEIDPSYQSEVSAFIEQLKSGKK